MSWFRDDEWSPEELAENERREEEERRKRADIQRRSAFASANGYTIKPRDPIMFLNCPTCGALVSLGGVEKHTAWHEQSAP